MSMVYFKPLLKGRPRPIAATQAKILHQLGKYALEEIKKEVNRSTLDNKLEIKKSLKYKVYPSSVTISSDHPAFTFLENGVRPHTMAYVRNKVIPIELEDLRGFPTQRERRQGIAFRRTGIYKSKSGKVLPDPKHPGYPAQHFVRNGIRRAKERIVQDIMRDMLTVSA